MLFCVQTTCIIVLSSFERLAALASGSRSGARWTAVTPEESPSFLRACVCVCSWRLRRRRRRRRRPASIYALRFFPLPSPPCAAAAVSAAFLDLFLSRPFCSLHRRSQESFYVKPHRVAHTQTSTVRTTKRWDRLFGGLVNSINSLCLPHSPSFQWRIS